jgi:AcrR family transcriptional regulator
MNRYEHTKQRIRNAFFDAAITLILEKGYDAISVTEICRLADYGRSTFYVHFKDKEDLVWAILSHNQHIMDEQVLAAVEAMESPEREWTAWYTIFQMIPLQRAFYLQLSSDLTLRLREWQKEQLLSVFESQLRAGIYSLLLIFTRARSSSRTWTL